MKRFTTDLGRGLVSELELALEKRLSARYDRKRAPILKQVGRFRFDWPRVSYLLSITITDEGRVIAEVRRANRDKVDLSRQTYDLGDRALFDQIARAAYETSWQDSLLVRVLLRVGEKLKALAQETLGDPGDWQLAYHRINLVKEKAVAEVTLQHPILRESLPKISHRLVLSANRYGSFHANLATRGVRVWFPPLQPGQLPQTPPIPVTTPARMKCWILQTPEAWKGKRWTAADAPHVVAEAKELVDRFVCDRLLAFESPAFSERARQAMLVLVPLRLAAAATKQDAVPWCLSQVDECLAALTRQPESAKTVVRKLFFQLVRLLLVKRTPQRIEAEAAYKALGLELAQRRQAEEDLPLNPALAYEQYRPRDGTAYLWEKLTKDESKNAALFLRQATLDQIVRAMKLA